MNIVILPPRCWASWVWLDRPWREVRLHGICSAALCNTAMNIVILKWVYTDLMTCRPQHTACGFATKCKRKYNQACEKYCNLIGHHYSGARTNPRYKLATLSWCNRYSNDRLTLLGWRRWFEANSRPLASVLDRFFLIERFPRKCGLGSSRLETTRPGIEARVCNR